MGGEIGVSIDHDFARFGSKAFAINKINTVEVASFYTYSRSPVIGLAYQGAL
jgi:hypothetical protein